MTTRLHTIEPSPELQGKVLARLSRARRRSARVRFVISAAALSLSSLALIPATLYALQQFYASGFSEYASLLFSDSAIALSHWQELGLSLLEALPSLPILLLIAFGVTFVWALSRSIHHARIAFTALSPAYYG